ncbi:ATP-binding cassette domain-containing protein [Undibacterium sp. LX40W]|uniref:ATP-binding cassette domain-containing protein n=1 Tax=Undibacterium nitidum TaxID=2762298 RepID=A0A923KQC6_9BURK|nr:MULTISPECIES: ATP-binding cassette domain-containing protein [Undibacterium]MBC3882768.1 ATP-binding cassette domain-containing protein [Undibacterium nitidum]MBC3893049.1 ATP-binding cassette domain-containing protein [Undibacterium sp. LX40W]
MQQEAIIEIEHLRSQFGRTVIHDDLNLNVYRGEIFSIVGGSGSGKTVLMRQMLGLEVPKQGIIRVFGDNIHEPKEHHLEHLRRRSGMLFQHGALYSALNVIENVMQPLRELGTLSDSLIEDIAYLKLHMSGISFEHAKKMPSDLSGGMIKRIALARAIALDPELLFLDEPTAGLDPDSSDGFVDLIRALHEELHLTVVMVTHDLDTLFALSSRIGVIADKKFIAINTPEEVAKVKHPFIETYFGGGRGVRAMGALPPRVSQNLNEINATTISSNILSAQGETHGK